MKYLEIFESFNPFKDKMGFGKQIQSHIKKLVGKNFGTPYVITSAEVTRAESHGFSDRYGQGDLTLTFKKEFPDELDDLISDLTSVGLSEEKEIEFGWDVYATAENDYDSSPGEDQLWNLRLNIYTDSPVIFLQFPEIFRGEEKHLYDMSYGVGGEIKGLIEKTIDSLVHESKMGNNSK